MHLKINSHWWGQGAFLTWVPLPLANPGASWTWVPLSITNRGTFWTWVRIYLCFPENRSSNSDQDKITKNEMIKLYASGGGLNWGVVHKGGFILKFFWIPLRVLEWPFFNFWQNWMYRLYRTVRKISALKGLKYLNNLIQCTFYNSI